MVFEQQVASTRFKYPSSLQLCTPIITVLKCFLLRVMFRLWGVIFWSQLRDIMGAIGNLYVKYLLLEAGS